ncbi:hypothetical protein F5X68DRAFT_279340 [Plectosphaerella plurivora]|uniref:Tachykinin family protein n=1 Tax=Plectosphaerella plurivora TaxID=936078 RepID=A0A9P8V238_9PEZI|nr:hypothetical protein F5X68DRAFT_279340 [Plectosphaerella plurivora]
MPVYEFVTFGDNNSSNATKAARSHAIRTALQRRNAPAQPSGDNDASASRPRPPQPASRGRFRVTAPSAAASRTRTLDPDAEETDIIKLAPTSKTQAKPQKTKARGKGKGKARSSEIPASNAETKGRPGGLEAMAMSPMSRLKDGRLDPFETLAIPSNSASDILLQFFLRGFNLNMSALDTQGPWLPYAMQNPVLLRATVALAAGFWSSSLPTLDVKLRHEGYLQKGETLRLIRKRLTPGPGTDSDHSTAIGATLQSNGSGDDMFVLAAVATLANGEAFTGELASAHVHLRGLYDLVQARGGVDSILHDYILCRCISWVDVEVATGLGRVPLFPLFHTIDQVILPSKVITDAAVPPALVHLEPDDADPLEERQDMAAARVIFMLLRQAICAHASSIPVTVASIRVIMTTADVRMLEFLFPDSDTSSHGKAQSPSRLAGNSPVTALVLAAHVFLYVVLRHVPTTSQLLRILCGRLRNFLQQGPRVLPAAYVVDAWTGNAAFLVWIAFAGVVGSGWSRQNADNAEWFRSLFYSAVLRAGDEGVISSAYDDDALEALLETFLWTDTECGTALESLRRASPDP